MIPVSIKVGRTAYAVHICAQPKSRYGRIIYKLGTIEIAPRSNDGMLSTFWHELTHAVLHDMQHPLHTDEAFVSAFSKRLHKAIKSARF